MRRVILFLILLVAVMATAGPNTRTVFDAFNPTAGTFVYCDTADPQGLTCTTGAAADDGWFNVRGLDNKSVMINPDTVSLTAGSIQFTIESRTRRNASEGWSTMTLIAPIDFAAAQSPGHPVAIFENPDQLRVGVRINGTDDAVDDSITVRFDGG